LTVIDRVETAESFLDWLQIAQKGEVAIYHVGHLSEARTKNRDLDKLGSVVLRAGGYRWVPPNWKEKAGGFQYEGRATVALVQKRCSGGFEYRAVRL